MSDNIMQELITKEAVASCIREQLTKANAADRCGVSVKSFTKGLQNLGMIYPVNNSRTHQKTQADADAVIEHIITHGGTISAAVRELEVSTTVTTIRKHIKTRGIDLAPYRHAYKKFGEWQVLPTQDSQVSKTQLLCKCKSCGTEKSVSRHNLVMQRSQRCMKCAAKARGPSTVISLDSELEFESIAALLRHFDIAQGYQITRLKLNRGEGVIIDGQMFKLKLHT